MRQPLQPNLIANPSFAGGSSAGWMLEQGWAIISYGDSPATPGGGYVAALRGPATSACSSLTKIMCSPGGNVAAYCRVCAEPGAAGVAVLRITFFDINDMQVSPNYGSAPVPSNYVWAQPRLVATAPDISTVSYAIVDFAVYNATSTARWLCGAFFGTYLPGAISFEPINYKQSLSYYLNLFTSQYKMSSRLNRWQAALMQPIDDLTNCLQTVNISYDIDNALGAQLDIIGQILGQNRQVSFQPSGGVSPILDDDTYRLLLYATQGRNTWNGKINGIYEIWQFLFPNGVLIFTDNQNMTAAVSTTGIFTSIQQDLINNGLIVPRPEGVLYNPTGPAPGAGIFGFDLNNSSIAGFDTGHFA